MYPHLLYGGLLRAGWVSYLMLGMLRLKKKDQSLPLRISKACK